MSRPRTLNQARETVRGHLRSVAEKLSVEGVPHPALDGKILRPLAAYLSVPISRRADLDERFWFGALAVEMVHEASLFHDDILDEAPQRRGRPTLMASAGVGPALVLGDHLLTGAYRAAAAAGSPEFLSVFIRAVERTVAGEIAQEKHQGQVLDHAEYARVITGKSGELFRAALCLGPSLFGIGSLEVVGDLGARLGRLYQMVDDFLDYCHHADRGKVPLNDYRQKKWTWPLGLIQATDFARPEAEVLSALFHAGAASDRAPMEEGAKQMGEEFGDLLAALEQEGMETTELGDLLGGWEELLHRAVNAEVELERARNSRLTVAEPYSPRGQEDIRLRIRRELQEAAGHLADPGSRLAYFARNAKSFRFASRLFPAQQLQQVAGVYAFCRFTDDLVDEADGQDQERLKLLIQEWLAMARQAFDGEATGVSLLDEVMAEMRASGVPFHYAEELVRGVEMDLQDSSYRTMNDLKIYSYRVASVVGGWLTQLFGIQDPWVLERAYDLGHAMQLTNILRDVGEDLRRGRLYLPQDLMENFGVDRELLEAKAANGTPAFPGYRSLLETLMAEAEAKYDRGFQALPALPLFFRGPVAVAASLYRGIHREIRKNGYDNLNRRARTSLLRKVVLGVSGLWRLRRTPVPELESPAASRSQVPGFDREKGQEVAA